MFQQINNMFEYLPLGGVVIDKKTQNKMFIVHGGIPTAESLKIEDIAKISRPIVVKLGANEMRSEEE